MELESLHGWEVTPQEAVALQNTLRERLVLRPPAELRVSRIAGADISTERGNITGYGGVVVLDAMSLLPLEQAGAAVTLRLPYIPGLLSFRELPVLAAAWEQLAQKPDLLIFDGQGIAHPRRFGLACHGGLLFGVPSIGCAKSLLVGTYGHLGPERGATAEIRHRGEVVGMAVRTRRGVSPVYVSPGHLMDLPTAVEWVLRVSPRYREPETTRRAHRLVNALRRAAHEPSRREAP
ncbi:deoxyribonuclease V [Hyalangium rubrum]|uniref:Endonuclease V n=1 Tax=Hyalangium rubrum TaxID=3103134 RepID=A0ABU5H7C3_9BACT|nr:deoxyribonuclease V [Hyalangium sp. s54d21]MDY7229196.1 deoxyribonuclease V [Hyalangium sp. s54d21]